tara:strand:- start:135 stop:701 length:567 start_codon:yes stop_codon:yes gene_type:complete
MNPFTFLQILYEIKKHAKNKKIEDIVISNKFKTDILNNTLRNEVDVISLIVRGILIELIEKDIISLENFVSSLENIDNEDVYNEDGSDLDLLLKFLKIEKTYNDKNLRINEEEKEYYDKDYIIQSIERAKARVQEEDKERNKRLENIYSKYYHKPIINKPLNKTFVSRKPILKRKFKKRERFPRRRPH